MRIFFATDVHGSEICWKKFLNAGAHYGADVVILGGDMTGKALVPVVDEGNGCLLYTSPSPRDRQKSRMPSSA